jgi:CRISPR/Cas system-associated endonuclease Cas1
LLGIEGSAARAYFEAFKSILRAPDDNDALPSTSTDAIWA